MKVRIFDDDLHDPVVEADYPTGFKIPDEHVMERTFTTDAFMGKGTYKEVFFEGMHIGYCDLQLISPIVIYFDSDFEMVKMHFSLKGGSVTHTDHGEAIEFDANQHNIVYTNRTRSAVQLGGIPDMKVFQVNILPGLFQRYLPDNHDAFEMFRTAIQQKKGKCLTQHNFPINPAMLYCIENIMHCQRHGLFKRMYIESQVINLLMLQLEQISEHDCIAFHSLKKTDIEKMYTVKEVLEQSPLETYTLADLARQAGTNEFTLKKGFKELFGTTVFGYWHELKMKQARRLLTEHRLSVQEVAEQVGYKHAHHFSTAFKKRFGVLPSQLKA